MRSPTFYRQQVSYNNLSEAFKLKAKDFGKQYSHIYYARLIKSRPALEQSIKSKWGSLFAVRQLTDLAVNEKVIICGTIYKHQDLKPNILRELSDEHQLPAIPLEDKFTCAKDFLILEDKLQRIILTGNISVHDYVTGVVVALLGFEDEVGKFHVDDVCFPIMQPATLPQFPNEKRFVAFISGLDIGEDSEMLLPIHEIVAYLVGKSGSPEVQEIMSRVTRLIIAGNNLSPKTQDRAILDRAKYLVSSNNAASIEAVQTLDQILLNLSVSVPVDVMPGANDPTNFVLPQQPLHRCMFPSSQMLSTLNMVTNPYKCEIDGIQIVGTSGQPITDILKNSEMNDPLDALEKTLTWGHLCPTAPDTLGCYPFTDNDPFILDTYPNVYFVGNQKDFSYRIWKDYEARNQVCLISIPRFCSSSSIVLLDLSTFDCFTVTIAIDKSLSHLK